MQPFPPNTPEEGWERSSTSRASALELFTLRKGYCISSSWGKDQLLELDLEVQTCTTEMILVSTVLTPKSHAKLNISQQ